MSERYNNLVYTLSCFCFVSFIVLSSIFFSITPVYEAKVEVLDVVDLRFGAYLKQFNKTYKGVEYINRLHNFKEQLKEIKILNRKQSTEVFGLTQFSDMSRKEFANVMLRSRADHNGSCIESHKNCLENGVGSLSRSPIGPLRGSWDWRTKGVISPVLNQQLCYGCWAFAIIGVMETMVAINRSHDWLSIQEVLDCSNYTKSCLGGNVQAALDFICNYQLPIVTAEQYPLTLKLSNPTDCMVSLKDNGVKLMNYSKYCNIDEQDKLLRLIAFHGPVIAIVTASNWMGYNSGVIEHACTPQLQDPFVHAVQIVGYNITGDIPYYIIKNSWGETFGEGGYVRIKIGVNLCGIADEVTMLNVY